MGAMLGAHTLSRQVQTPRGRADGLLLALMLDLSRSAMSDSQEAPTLTDRLSPLDPSPARDAGVWGRGDCLGRYVILYALGSGSMGNVYAAHDPELDRKIALKVLRADVQSSASRAEARARLLREAQAGAKLAHPNVVTVHDVGSLGDRIFVAMEMVDGLTLGRWSEEKERSWQEILEVFLQAGQGLSAAHGRGFVHRDFKPSNVMVGRDGRARILDFGLVRATGGGPTAERLPTRSPSAAEFDAEITLTSTGDVLGTPAYMAPEQQAGQLADARSDQFSFCVALYRILYGSFPYRRPRGRSQDFPELRDPPADSPVPARIRKALLRGLARDPGRRYRHMDALLADLEGPPILSRRMGFAGLAMAVLTAWFVVSPTPATPCQGAERRLAGIWDLKQKGGIQAVFAASGLPIAESAWQETERLVDAYAENWVDMHTEACTATQVHGEQSARMLDLRMACLDTRLDELQAFGELLSAGAPKVIESSSRVAAGLTSLAGCADRQTLGKLEPPARAATRRAVARIRSDLAAARVQEKSGNYALSLEMAKAAVHAAEELGYRPVIAEAHFIQAFAHGRLRQPDELQAHLLVAMREAKATHHDEFLALAMNTMIIVGYHRGDADQALLWGELAGAAIEALGGRDDIEARRLERLGIVANMAGDFELAVKHYRASLAINPSPDTFQRMATQNNIGRSYAALGRFDLAEESLRQALKIVEEAFGPDHVFVVKPLNNLGILLHQRGDLEAARVELERAVRLAEATFGREHPETSLILESLGRTLVDLGDGKAATEILERGRRGLESLAGNPVDLATTRFELARARYLVDRDQGTALREALKARQVCSQHDSTGRRCLDRIEPWLQAQGWLQ